MKDVFTQNAVPNPALLLAPMEGVTGPVFRELIDQIGGMDLVATEFVRITSGRQGVKPFERFTTPLQIQLMSCEAKTLKESIVHLKAKEVLFEHDWLDLNVGCPSKRVTSHGAGSALLLTPKVLLNISSAMREAHPEGKLSIKTRLGYNSEEDFAEILRVLADCPLDFVTIHARSKAAKYEGPIHFDKLAQAVETLPYPVIGNGDIWTPEDARSMLKNTGVRGLMCGRGAIANPFLFLDIRHGSPVDPVARRDALLEFARELLYKLEARDRKRGQHIGVFKEFAGWLSQNLLIGRDFFVKIKRLTSYSEIAQALSAIRLSTTELPF
ncbi:MAG: tRNA-dihydrouridine synthase [Bdellovibrionales bacterium]|nr:tRNA-dihydrouridine synthase [Bdellovibrionales bacterium]